jgi:hypothetical protein
VGVYVDDSSYRDKKVVGVFVRFRAASSRCRKTDALNELEFEKNGRTV